MKTKLASKLHPTAVRLAQGIAGSLAGICAGDAQAMHCPHTPVAARNLNYHVEAVGTAAIRLIDGSSHSTVRQGIAVSGTFRTSLDARVKSVVRMPAQPVDATQALNLSAGVSNCKVSRGRSFS